ncbi:hypothetical protein EX30DRAFT_371415 [Ascodesmis nigricans]|uniref:Vacuolar protein sorting-associated protein 62 n=1 Tax=Ascodesmis nigricans TaxID=341454 RepID=A0A4S2MXR9_9PEZI|nr:hypothetical protein EX30DRAFT_371415 [Ascodesmis nigricans]
MSPTTRHLNGTPPPSGHVPVDEFSPLPLLVLAMVTVSSKALAGLCWALTTTWSLWGSSKAPRICTNWGESPSPHLGDHDWDNWHSMRDPAVVPSFVLDYAPFVWLYSDELFMPGKMTEHLKHTVPYLYYDPIITSHANLTTLNDFNQYGDGLHVYLTSEDDPSEPPLPRWLTGSHNTPITTFPGAEDEETNDGRSSAPAIIIWVEKGPEIVDAFYFYFYSFNLGNTVAGWRFGNHVGDWEHNAIRFINGVPTSMHFSEHSGGAAYTFPAVSKIGDRPVSFSAIGTHANYATPGIHYYAIPFHLLADHTNRGHLWDIKKNNLVFHYNLTADVLTADNRNKDFPVEWFHYEGRWGDRRYPESDKRQYGGIAGQYAWVSGPQGPKSKNLGRTTICIHEEACDVKESIWLDEVWDGEWEVKEWGKDLVGVQIEGVEL